MTTAESIIGNAFDAMQLVNPTLKTRLIHETGVILGDVTPSAEEIDAAQAKEAKINASATGVTEFKDGLKLSAYDQACLDAAS